MTLSILAFSQRGLALAKKIQATYPGAIYHKDLGTGIKSGDFKALWEASDQIIFIGATGIAVRYIAPHVQRKDRDPAVLVVDDGGRYVISLLSGHLGGANQAAQDLARTLEAQAIITTASDSRGFEAPDLFAKRLGYGIDNLRDLAQVTSLMLDKKPLAFYSEEGARPDYPYFTSFDRIEDIEGVSGALLVTSSTKIDLDLPHALLRPKNLHLGLGAKKGADYALLRDLLEGVFKREGLALASIKDMASIDIKAQEEALVRLSQDLGIPFKTFSKEDLRVYERDCQRSDFVRKRVGVGSVSCTAALALGGKKVIDKETGGGFTLSVTKEM
ncbi:MAG: cobalt-precorrin 5A hydrolase [Tissierellia bacterium]|nr:cobalt-precorrin 5A hydrolase [Tissierellia bacterium]